MATVDNPVVSVLMTAFNRERYVGPAIESVQAQTFKEWELIVVDDCSTDSTLEVARRYAASDTRIRVYRNEHNLGDYRNRNHAASFARGEYIKYHDSDDIMYPHCLAIMHGLLAAEPKAQFALSGSHSWVGAPAPILLSPRQAYQREFLGPGDLFKWGPSCALFRTTTFQALGGFPDRGVVSDMALWFTACARFSLLLVPSDLFWYRVHAAQEFQKTGADREHAAFQNLTFRRFHRDEVPLEAGEFELARQRALWALVQSAWQDLRARRWSRFRLRTHGISLLTLAKLLRRPLRNPLAGIGTDAEGAPRIPPWVRNQGVRATELNK
ncbi:MAG: glycosyltransferase family 2 protein [Bryobacteraceae bacterium]